MRIGLLGLRRTGKDAIAASLVARHGYIRRSVGDFIKGDVDPLVRKHFGFSAFTEVDEEKEKIRALLETWGAINSDSVLKRFYENLPPRVVNGRVQLIHEADRWAAAGGVFIIVDRPGSVETPYEKESVRAAINRVFEAGYIQSSIWNSGTLDDLDHKVNAAVEELKRKLRYNT